jgi:hypothetical protein
VHRQSEFTGGPEPNEPIEPAAECNLCGTGSEVCLGVAGIAAVVAIVLGLRLKPEVAIFGTLIVLGLMFILVIFANFAGQAGPVVVGPARALVWFFTVATMIVMCLFISSYFVAWPLNLN